MALALNLTAPFSLTRRLAPLLRAGGHGSVVNVSSIYGLVGPNMGLYEGTRMGNPAAYAASKGGLAQLTRYLSTVLAPEVRVNAFAPGGIARGQDDAFVERYERLTPWPGWAPRTTSAVSSPGSRPTPRPTSPVRSSPSTAAGPPGNALTHPRDSQSR